MNLKLVLVSDHTGVKFKKFIIENFANYYKQEIEFIDLGPDSSDSVDYPDYAYKAACCIQNNMENSVGIFICATGIGMNIAANRFSFLRSACCDNSDTIKYARMHNNINVLCLGAKLISQDYALQLIQTFLETKFLGAHHQPRIIKLSNPKSPSYFYDDYNNYN